MCDGYNLARDDDHSDLEDEFLCEYVDGTMDPVVREVFEEYLCANPDLKDHVECLRSTRMLLCRYGCRCRAPFDLHDRLRRELTCELMSGRVPFYVILADRFKGVATATSAVALLLVLGWMSGAPVSQTDEGYAGVAAAAVVGSQDKPREPFRLQETRPALMINNAGMSPRMSPLSRISSVRSVPSSDFGRHLSYGTDTSHALTLAAAGALP